MQVFKKIFAATLFLLFSTQMVLAGTTGKIAGTVKDKNTGEPLIGADVVLEGTGLGSSTDSDGYFVIINIPPGNYNLAAYYVGYAGTTIENIRVSVDRTTSQNIAMPPATVEGEEVTVEADRAAIQMDRTHSASIVNSETVDLMPVTEVSEVLELQSGVVSTGGELHFRGGRAREVTYIIDGVPVTNEFSQGGGSNVNVETNMIEELEVISGTFNAEYGSAQSGVVNIVTKRPARSFSGNVQYYAGEWLSNQDDIFLNVNDFNPAAEQDIQFSLTGPIISDKLGFYISGRHNDYESLDNYERRFNLYDGWRIGAYQSWTQLYSQGAGGGLVEIPDSFATGDLSRGPLRLGTSSSFSGKLTFTPHPKLTMIYQAFASLDEFDGPPDPNGLGGDSFRRYQPDGSGTSRSWEYSHFFRFQHFPSENFFYNLAFSYQHEDGERFFNKNNQVAFVPGDEGIQPVSAFANGFSLGSTDFFYTDAPGKNFYEKYLVIGDINWQVDKYNLIKAGFEINKHNANVYSRQYRATPQYIANAFPIDRTAFANGAFLSYEQYWDSLQGYWQNWEQNFNSPRFVAAADSEANLFRDFNVDPMEYAFYVQDKLELGEDIIVNAGVRLDIFQPNSSVPINLRTESFNLGIDQNLKEAETKYQLSPRLGISFPISSDGAFHAAYGHFFQMPAYQRMFNEPLVSLTPLQLDGRRLGNADLEAERTIAYEIGLQQALTQDISVDITAYYKDIENLLGIERVTTIDRVAYTRYVNRDYGNSRGLTLGFTKRGGRVTGNVNYTMSFANGSNSSPEALQLIVISTQIGGDSEVFAQRKILPLNWDQRHAIKASVNYAVPKNWSIGLVGFVETGVPFSPDFFARFDLNELEYQNSALRPTRWSVDLKAKKNLNLFGLRSSLFLKVDNLFDHLNEDNVFASTGRALLPTDLPEAKDLEVQRLEEVGLFTYDEANVNPDNFSPPRNIQLGLELKF